MEIKGKENRLMDIEKKLYLLGAIGLAGLFLFTIIFGSLFSPLRLLQVRLYFVGMGLAFFLAVYFYQQRSLKKKLENLEEQQNEIIIYFNGKELARK